ncbi:MAG: DUF3772 domain-containing protein, partial [Hyphomicrobiaceae bacterium]|nr:DUF3772 domain-containing protein [Hyphomicrobiaceae bacterium]
MNSRPPSRRRLLLAALLIAVIWPVIWLGPVAAQAPSPDQTQSAPSVSAQAQPAKPELPAEVADNVGRLTAAIETAEKTIQHLAELEEELGGLRVDVETILDDSSQVAEALRPQLAAVRSQIDKLGPPPGKDGPTEAPALAAERARLSMLAAGLDGAIKSTELTWVRARQLIEKITVLRHSLFAKNLLERRPSPLLPGLWRDLMGKAPPVGNRISYLANDWLRWASIKRLKVGLLLGAVVILFVGLHIGLGRPTNRRQRRSEPPAPSFFERAMSVAWLAPLRALPTIAAALLLYAGLDAMDLLFPPWGVTAAAVLKAVVLYAAVSALIFAMLAPSAPQWRLVSLADGPTRRVGVLLCAIAALYAIDGALTEISRVFFIPLALTVVQTFATSIGFAALLIGLLLTSFTPQPAETAAAEVATPAARAAERYPRHAPRWLKLPLWLIALAILGLALSGYVALARFVAQQLVLTG